MRRHRLQQVLLVIAASGLTAGAAETVLFEDNFETDTSANWTVNGTAQDGVEDHLAIFNYDYSAAEYTFNGATMTVPPSPNSDGTTHGVRLQVNLVAPGSPAAVNLYPNGQSFSGDYALRFDMFMSYNGGVAGGAGSTEHALMGLNHIGDTVNWYAETPIIDSDGVYFAIANEAQAGETPVRDLVAFEGEDGLTPLELVDSEGGFLDRDGNGDFEDEYPTGAPLGQIFPSPPFETTGGPSKHWVEVELRQQGGLITWTINGYVLAERQSFVPWTEGNIMIGLMDVFASLANPEEHSFAIFDNVRVVDLTGEAARPRLTIAAGNPAAEPSTDGSFTITREGDTSTELTVALRTRGTAVGGEDYTAIPATVTIPAGESTLEVPVDVLDDPRGEQAETIILDLVATGFDYEVFAPSIATIELADDGDTTGVTVTAADAHAYELFPEDTLAFRVTRVGDTSTDLTVNYTLGGTAQAGTHYETVASSVTIPAAEASALVTVVPIDDNVVNESRTVTLQIAAGTGYVVGAEGSATGTIRNDDLEPGATVLFEEDFDDETGVNWAVNSASEGNNSATFQFDYGALGIPAAPNSEDNSRIGLKIQANNGPAGVAPFTGISVSPLGQEFTGDYRVSFDMWNNFPGPLDVGGTGSTMMQTAGIGTFGTAPQFPGTSVDGALFAVSGDGGAAADYRAYLSTGAPVAPDTGAYFAGTQSTAQNNTHPYYTAFGGRTAPEDHLALFPSQTDATSPGAVGAAWHEVTITKIGTIVTWSIDNYPIARVDLGDKETGNNLSLGFFDINTSQVVEFDLAFGLFDNLKVEALETVVEPGTVEITGITHSGDNVVISFDADPVNQDFTVLGSETVDGEYDEETGVTFTQVGAGEEATWTATVPMTSDNRFFIIQADAL